MDTLHQLLYVSRADDALTGAGLGEIVSVSMRNNARRDISGMLLFSGVHFAQVLEGEGGAIAALMEVIKADRRHHGVRVLGKRPADERNFASWSMAYVEDLGAADLLAELWMADAVPAARIDWTIAYLFRSLPQPA